MNGEQQKENNIKIVFIYEIVQKFIYVACFYFFWWHICLNKHCFKNVY